MNARHVVVFAALVFLVLFAPNVALAQGTPQNGLAMGYPAAAGVLWNISNRVALWPELIAVRHASTTTNNGPANDNNSVGVGIRVLLYLAPAHAFRPYIAPQFDYTRTHTTQNTTTTASATTVSFYSGAASFGAQYSVSARFGVFGELGLEYDHEKGTGSIVSHGNTTGTRNAVGVIVFF